MFRMKKCVTKGVADVPVILQLEALECGAVCLFSEMGADGAGADRVRSFKRWLKG